MRDPDDQRSAAACARGPGRAGWLLLVIAAGMVGYALSDDSFLGGAPGYGRVQQAIAALGIALAASVWLLPRWRARLALGTVAALVTTTGAELAFRPILGPILLAPFDYDEVTMFRLRPGAEGAYQNLPENGGALVQYSINADGFRGPPLRSDAALRVAVYGDSFIEAVYSTRENTLCARLADELTKATSKSVEVVNCGVNAYGPDQSLLKLRRELPTLRPDLVVFSVFTGNDFGDLQRNKMFRFTAGGTLQQAAWELAPDLREPLEIGGHESVLMRAFRRIGNKAPVLAGWAEAELDGGSTMLRNWLASAEAEHRDYLDNHVVTNIAWDHFNADVCLEPDSESAKLRCMLMKGVLGELHATMTTAKVPCLVLIIPDVVDCCPRKNLRVDGTLFPHYDRRNLVDAALRACTAAGVESLDLLDTLSGQHSDDYFLRGRDFHWSDAGQERAATILARHLVDRRLLPTNKR